MKKLFVIIAVLSLIAGTAYAADLNDGLNRQVWAQAKGRSVVSDGSVLLRVWYTGSDSGTIGVSNDSISLYDNGVRTGVSFLTYRTVGQVVDYINNQTTWKAAIGPDSYSASNIGNGDSLAIPLTVDTATAGTSKLSPTNVYRDSGTAKKLSVGIETTEGKYNRIKSITHNYSVNTSAGAQILSVLVYDGDTVVYRKDVNTTAYNSATSPHASPNTISFVDYTDKGLAGSYGKSLVAVVSSSSAVLNGAPNGDKLSDHNISILYDQF